MKEIKIVAGSRKQLKAGLHTSMSSETLALLT